MGQDEKIVQQSYEVVEHIVRRQLARKAMHDIHQQVDEIEHQINSEKRNARYLLPLILVFFILALLFLVDVPQLSRLFSSLF